MYLFWKNLHKDGKQNKQTFTIFHNCYKIIKYEGAAKLEKKTMWKDNGGNNV